jgi:WD40 repeat protein
VIVLNGRRGQATWLEFTADSRRLACARGCFQNNLQQYEAPGGIDFWNIARGKRAKTIIPKESVSGFVLHPGGKWAYANLYALCLVNLTTGGTERLAVTFGLYFPVAVSPDGKRVVASVNAHSAEPGEWIVCWEHATAGPSKLAWERKRGRREMIPYLIAFFPDGQQFACYEAYFNSRRKWARQITIRSATGGRVLQTGECDGAESLLVSPDGTRLIVSSNGKVRTYDANDLARPPVVVLDEPDPGWWHLDMFGRFAAYHPKGWYVALTNNTPTVRFFDPASWRVAKKFTWDAGELRSITFSPDGCLAAAGSGDGRIVVWDVDN